MDALPNNRYVIEMIAAKRAQEKEICKIHKQPLITYCKETTCQSLVCYVCMLTDHVDHKVEDINKKSEKIRKTLKKMQRKNEQAKEEIVERVHVRKKIIEEMQITAGKTVNDIETAGNKIVNEVTKAIEEYKVEVMQKHNRQCRKLTEECNMLLDTITDISISEERLDVAMNNSDMDVIRGFDEVKNTYKQTNVAARSIDAIDLSKSYEVTSFKPVKFDNIDIRQEVFGELQNVAHLIPHIKKKETEKADQPTTEESPSEATHVVSWKCHGNQMCANELGQIFITNKEDTNDKSWLHMYNIRGEELHTVAFDTEIEELASVCDGIRNMLVLWTHGEKDIELRGVLHPGLVLDAMNSPYGSGNAFLFSPQLSRFS